MLDINLIKYEPKYQEETLIKMADFFGFHRELYDKSLGGSDFTVSEDTIKTLERWISADNALYIIILETVSAGFIHIGYRGENVAWIEDIYVDKKFRGKGIASQAIKQAEEIIAQNENYTAVCIDVLPRNIDALKLYHRLGYTDLSILTLRKEFRESKRGDRDINLLGFDFKY